MSMIDSKSHAGLDLLHEAMAARVAKGELPGMVTLVARRDDVHVDTIGVMAFGSDEPMRRDTIFRITSMTKPILALATMMLVEDGRLALDEPVDRLLPELANRRVLRNIDGPLDDTVPARRPITVLDLLTFRMGHGLVMEPTFDPPYPIVNAARDLELVMGPPDPRTPHDPDEWLRRFATLPLMYQPGERWQYNTGSLVLGVLVARASRMPLPDFFRTRIFEPLGMKDTGFWITPERTGRLPSQYMTNFQTGKMEQQTLTGPTVWTKPPVFPSGAAGLLSRSWRSIHKRSPADAEPRVLRRWTSEEGPAGRAPDGACGPPHRESRCPEGEGDRVPEQAPAVESSDVEARALRRRRRRCRCHRNVPEARDTLLLPRQRARRWQRDVTRCRQGSPFHHAERAG